MKLVTWNVNSIKARLPRVLEFLDTHAPDVLCVQETKTTSEDFPHLALAEKGYRAVEHSSGRWTGVAIITREGLDVRDPERGLAGTPLPDEARWIEATVEGLRVVSVYVVNGRTLDDPMYRTKLEFLDRMIARAGALAATPSVIVGDYNIAPADVDVYDPEKFVGTTHTSDAERERLRALLDSGFVDAYRHLHPEEVQYTWWDYRMGHFHRGMGLRIDLALVSADVASRLSACGIERPFRKGPKPSDHAPLVVQIDAAS